MAVLLNRYLNFWGEGGVLYLINNKYMKVFSSMFMSTTKGPNNFGYSIVCLSFTKVLYRHIMSLHSHFIMCFITKFDYGCEFAQHSLTLTHWNINCVGDFTENDNNISIYGRFEVKERLCVWDIREIGCCWTNWPLTQGTIW